MVTIDQFARTNLQRFDYYALLSRQIVPFIAIMIPTVSSTTTTAKHNKKRKLVQTTLHNSLQAALSRSVTAVAATTAQSSHNVLPVSRTRKVSVPRRRNVAKHAKSNSASQRVSRRWKYIAPQFRDYFMYARTIALSSRKEGVVVRLPHIGQERFHLALEANDSTLFARSTNRVTSLNEARYNNDDDHGSWTSSQRQRQKSSTSTTAAAVFNERFLRAVRELFDVNPRIIWSSVHKNIHAQLNGSGIARQWTHRYQNDSNLGLFDSHVPIIMRVIYGRENEEESQYLRFVRDTHAPAVKLDLEPVLSSRLRLELFDRTDSLLRTVLRDIGSRSLYYQRIYMAHLLIWMTVCQCLRDHNHRLVIFVQSKLRPLIQLCTSPSVLLHTDRRITLDYL